VVTSTGGWLPFGNNPADNPQLYRCGKSGTQSQESPAKTVSLTGPSPWKQGPIEGGEDQLLTGNRLQDVSWTTARICGTNRNQDHSEDRDPNQCFFFRKLVHDNTTSAGGPLSA
jgi:hypothetical protein